MRKFGTRCFGLFNVALVVAAALTVPVLQAAEEDPWDGRQPGGVPLQ